MADFRRFLGKTEEIVAPVVGRNVWLRDRRLVLNISEDRSGWFRVRVSGRKAELLGAATDDEVSNVLTKLPALRGPVVAGLLVHQGLFRPIDLVRSPSDAEEPPLFAPLRARMWPVGEVLLWDELEWEGEAEEAARIALDEQRGLGEVKGASANLRTAFAFATAQAVSRALQIPAAPIEIRRWVREIAEEGRPAAERALRVLAAERAVWAARRPVVRNQPANHYPHPKLEDRVEDSLRGAGARMLGVRQLGGGQIEVRWQFNGTRFISVVEEATLHVIDSGVCLAGSDGLVTLDSLPGVIRQAMDEDALVITRHEGE